MEERLTITDVRQAGLCVRGARRFFQHHGVDFADFVKNGISLAEAEATGDALVLRVIESKRKREEANGR